MLAIFGFACAAMFSCTKENGGKTGGEVKPGETGYFSIELLTNQRDAVNRGFEGEVTGTGLENFVDGTLYVLLYKTDGTLAYRIPIELSNNSSGNIQNFTGNGLSTSTPGSNKVAITKGYPVTAQAYNMIVIANPTAAVTAATDVTNSPLTLAQFKDKSDDAIMGTFPFNTTTIPTATRFLMSNNRTEVAVAVTDLKSSAEQAEASPVVVNIDRMFAKIEFGKSVDGTDDGFETNMTNNTKILSWTNLSWNVDVINKLSFWMRKKSVNHLGNAETATESRQNMYALDPNMDIILTSNTPTYTNNFSAVTLNNAYVTATTGETVKEAKDIDDSPIGVYVPENTFVAAAQAEGTWESQATNVIVKIQIVPNHSGLTAGNYTIGYYTYEGFVFLHSEALGWVRDGTQMPSEAVNAGLTVDKLKTLEWFWNPAGGGSAVTTPPTEYGEEEIDSKALIYHHQCWNVYRIPIKHFDVGNPSQQGDYGVVRNNWYRVVLNSINGPGGGSSEQYISASVTILDWVQREQIEDL